MTVFEKQERVLRAAIDRVIPADDAPCASDAGVLDYFTLKFEGDFAGIAERFAAGLEALDAEATVRFGRSFVVLGPLEQDDVLRFVESGHVLIDWPVPSVEFFTLLVTSTAEGYYGDPGNGGNRDEVSWKMCGFTERIRV